MLTGAFTALDIEPAEIASTAASSPYTVNTQTVSYFTVSAPASVTAGSPFTVTVTAKDANGQTVTDYVGTLHFTSTDTAASVTLPADYTFTAADNGVHTFTNAIALLTSGQKTVTASDKTIASVTGTSGAITVNSAKAITLALTTPASTVAGATFMVTVTLKDVYGNIAAGYRGIVHFSSTDINTGVVLPADYQFTAEDAGTHTFPYVILANATLSPYPTITVTDKYDISLSATSCNIFVAANYLTKLVFIGLPDSVLAGQVVPVKIQLQDAYGNRFLAESIQTISLFTSSGGWYSDTAHQHPIGSTTVQYMQSETSEIYYMSSKARIDTLSASTNNVNPAATSITVLPSTINHFTITGYPEYIITGKVIPNNIIVTAYDAYGNVKTDYTGEAYFISSDLCAKLPYTPNHRYTFVAADKGVHSFGNFTFTTEGSQTISVVDRMTYVVTSSNPITVSNYPYYTVAVTQNNYGTISPETLTVQDGSNLTYTITPNIYHHIASITVDGRPVAVNQSSGQTVSFLNIKTDHNITATFAMDIYTLTINSAHTYPPTPMKIALNGGSNYTVSVSSPDIINSTDRWICLGYSLDGGALVSGTSYTFSRITANHTIIFSWVEQVTNMLLLASNPDHTTTTLHISGNVNANQFSNFTITPHANTATTTFAFNLSGPSGTDGFVNMTLPKSAVAFGQVPSVYADSPLVQTQGYTEDGVNYYVWFSIHFSSHLIKIEFKTIVKPTPTPTISPTEEPTPTPTPDPTAEPTPTATPSPTIVPTDGPTATPTIDDTTPVPADSDQTLDSTKIFYGLIIFLVVAILIVFILKR